MQSRTDSVWRLKRCAVILLSVICFPAAQAVAQAPITLRIVSPADGTTVEPGQVLTVEVNATPTDQFAGVAVISPITSDFKTSPPFLFALNIPPDAPLGPQLITAFIGLGKDDFVDRTITINIETATSATNLRADLDEIRFVRSRQEQLLVEGTFADGQIRDVTKSGETTYVSGNSRVASVSAEGLVEAIENGTAIITITYKGQSDTIPVSVNSIPKERLDFTCLQLQLIVNTNPDTPLADKVEDARAKCQTAVDELIKTPPDEQAAVGNIEGTVGDLQAAVDTALLDPTDGTKNMDQLAGTARQLAAEALDQAIAGGGDSVIIADAQQALAAGDTLRASGAFKEAVNRYKDALVKAERIAPMSGSKVALRHVLI